LILPSLRTAEELLWENRKRQSRASLELCGESLAFWRTAARDDLIRAATRYTQTYRSVAFAERINPTAPIIMAGHQPTLFHPGVWFKNFAIDAIARRLSARSSKTHSLGQAVAINLIIDNDIASSSSIRIPTYDAFTGQIGRAAVAYDSAASGVAFEQNRIRDRATFNRFAAEVRSAISPLVSDPLVDRLWPHAIQAAGRCENVSCALAQARHALEGEIGLQTLELPLSVVCRSESFMAFAISVLCEAARFRTVYNRSADQYRKTNRIRSSAHPVPNLGIDGEWVETPFWIYSDDFPQRRGAWTRINNGQLEISDRNRHSISIALPIGRATPAQLQALCGSHFKLRPRALATTMYARVVLSDLFVHGIGGAKYDELGDQITKLFWGVEPPELMVVSATVWLPINRSINHSGALAANAPLPTTVVAIRNEIRRTHFAPETFCDRIALSPELCQNKLDLIANPPLPHAKKAWHDRLTAINAELSSDLEGYREMLRQHLPQVQQAATVAQILSNREYSFCLFPLEELTRTLSDLVK